jgi:hypothetical protein
MVRLAPVEGARVNEAPRRSKGVRALLWDLGPICVPAHPALFRPRPPARCYRPSRVWRGRVALLSCYARVSAYPITSNSRRDLPAPPRDTSMSPWLPSGARGPLGGSAQRGEATL